MFNPNAGKTAAAMANAPKDPKDVQIASLETQFAEMQKQTALLQGIKEGKGQGGLIIGERLSGAPLAVGG
jgi:hypothetical protein